jgi:hypothetical protein
VTEAPRPPSGRASVSPRVMWLQTRLLVQEGFGAVTCPVALGHAHALLRCLTSGSSCPRQARGAGNALNIYVTGHTQRMADIKYVQDIDVAGQRQYGADMPNIHNRQAVRGDLTPRSSKAATVLGDSSTRTISRMGAMWWKDVIWHSSGHQHYHWLLLARVPLQYRVQLPWSHLSGPGAQCDHSNLVL